MNLRIYINKITPYFVGKIIYKSAYELLRLLFISRKHSIWCRNSYKQNYWKFLLSDIDITIYAHKKISNKQLRTLANRYFIIKKFIPILGELNLYSKDTLSFFWPIANPYEISRDPSLKKISPDLFKDTEHKIVFLLRMLESDYLNLVLNFKHRKDKWQKHFQSVEISSSPSSLNDIIKNIQSLMDTEIRLANFYQEFGLLRIKKFPFHEMDHYYKNTIYKKEFWLLCPQLAVGLSTHNNNLYQDLLWIQSLRPSFQKLILRNIQWELWGLLTQYHQTNSSNHLLYLKNLQSITEKLITLPTDETMAAINKLFVLFNEKS